MNYMYMCVPLWLWQRKEFSHDRSSFVLIFPWSYVLHLHFAISLSTNFNQESYRFSMNLRLFMKNTIQRFYETIYQDPFHYIFFLGNRELQFFLSVFVVVRVTPCLLCKYKSYIAFSSLSLNSKTFTEWLSVTVNDTVRCLVNPGSVY